MAQAAVRPIPPIRLFSTITGETLLRALAISAAILAALIIWHFREEILFQFRAARTDDLIGEMLREATNGTHYGWD